MNPNRMRFGVLPKDDYLCDISLGYAFFLGHWLNIVGKSAKLQVTVANIMQWI